MYNSTIFYSDTRKRWLVSFTLRPIIPREKAHRIHWIGGWVSITVGLHAVKKIEICCP
jgi:hypothetical protein